MTGGRMMAAAAVAAALACSAITGCGATAGHGTAQSTPQTTYEPPSSPTRHHVGRYEQTWHRPYSRTRCRVWLDRMSVHQRFVSVADMLSGARDKGDGGSGVAPDRLIRKFEADMFDVCSIAPARPITDVAVAIYLGNRGKYAPK